MTQEEKAKLYDELKVKAQELAEDGYIDKLALVDMFPELKESEGERIRKELIAEVKEKIGCIPAPDCRDKEDEKALKQLNKWLAWLEKQGEKGTNGNEREIPSSEHEPDDKVEPKFKAGDWVVYKGDICQIVKREEDCNKLVTVFGTEKEPVNERNLSTARLWSIQDAKDGDVLADKFGVILFRKIGNEKYADAVDYYCAGFESGGFIIQEGVSYWGLSKEEELHPTTLEQRVRFFDTMGDAGYAWDAEKKELKKIEQNPAWSEEDNAMLISIENILIGRGHSFHDKEINWLKSLKDRYTWKPSDEQMKALDFYIRTYVDTEGCYGSEVLELYEQLKKLREE